MIDPRLLVDIFIGLAYFYLGLSLGKKGRNLFLAPSFAVLFFTFTPVWVVLYAQKKYGYHATPVEIAVTSGCTFVGYLLGKSRRRL